MKRLLFVILLFGVYLHVSQTHVQQCLPGVRDVQLTGGLSDNIRWKDGDGFGYHAGIAVGTYTKNARHWVVGAEYLEKRYDYRDCLYPASQFTGEGGYYLSFLSDRKKIFFVALGLSALTGHGAMNWGESLLPDGSRFTDEDNFTYGGALTLELSTYVMNRIVLLVNGRQRMLFGGDYGKFHTQIGVRIRFMI